MKNKQISTLLDIITLLFMISTLIYQILNRYEVTPLVSLLWTVIIIITSNDLFFKS